MKILLSPLRRPVSFLLTLALGAAVLAACETEVDPNDDYHETTFVYAVLDPALPRQTVRINKAFLNTRTDARVIAAGRPDSITFPPGVIQASIERLVIQGTDTTVDFTYPLRRTEVDSKVAGTFSSPRQVIWQTPPSPDSLPPLDSTRVYRVRVLNKRTGQVTTGATSLPSRFQITAAGTRFPGPNVGPADTLDFEPEKKTRIQFKTQPKAGIYRADLVFHYQEVTGTTVENKVLTWELLGDQAVSYQGNPDYPAQALTFTEKAFFDQFLVPRLDVSNDPPGRYRIAGNVIYRVTAGSPQWGEYISRLNASSALLQTTPEYTNLRGGRGLVAGRPSRQILMRVRTPLSKQVFNEYPQLKFRF